MKVGQRGRSLEGAGDTVEERSRNLDLGWEEVEPWSAGVGGLGQQLADGGEGLRRGLRFAPPSRGSGLNFCEEEES